MTRVFLAAGVAALAIAAPANAGPHNGKDKQSAQVDRRGGGGQQARQQRQQQRQSLAPQRMERQQRFAAVQRPQREERIQRRADRRDARPQHVERQQVQRAERDQVRTAERHQARPQRIERAQTRTADRRQIRDNRVQQQRMVERQQLRTDRHQQAQAQIAERQQVRANRVAGRNLNKQIAGNNGVGYGVGGCPPGLGNKGCTPPGLANNLLAERHALRADRIANADLFRTSRIARALDLAPRTRFIEPARAVTFIGEPLRTVSNVVTLSALPQSVSYLYPATPNYYYQYGGGYLYQVDRSSSLISALIPLLAGGFLPGTYLPQTYMSSYVPSYYGLNSFYPASYGYGYGAAYGYGGYNNICNRYAYGTVYQVDCMTGMVVNVIPTYAGGYGVGQMLPSAYSYYNLPMQYRSMYYPTADYSYWYAPGAIYQYDRGSSLITSVAALMSPGFSIGQPLPMGYNYYNVPMGYRATYYDTPNAWYRYNNGYIYQVDPSSMLVTAIVASLLT